MDRLTGKPLGGVDHLAQSIGDILGTPLGTRVARREYGSRLPELIDQPMNDLTRVRLYAATALALLRQEPRVRLSRVAFVSDGQPGSATVRLTGTRTDVARANSALDLTIPLRGLSALA